MLLAQPSLLRVQSRNKREETSQENLLIGLHGVVPRGSREGTTLSSENELNRQKGVWQLTTVFCNKLGRMGLETVLLLLET